MDPTTLALVIAAALAAYGAYGIKRGLDGRHRSSRLPDLSHKSRYRSAPTVSTAEDSDQP